MLSRALLASRHQSRPGQTAAIPAALVARSLRLGANADADAPARSFSTKLPDFLAESHNVLAQYDTSGRPISTEEALAAVNAAAAANSSSVDAMQAFLQEASAQRAATPVPGFVKDAGPVGPTWQHWTGKEVSAYSFQEAALSVPLEGMSPQTTLNYKANPGPLAGSSVGYGGRKLVHDGNFRVVSYLESYRGKLSTNLPKDEVVGAEDGRTRHLLLNRPRALNALNSGMVDTINDLLLTWKSEPFPPSSVIIRSTSPRAFCAGGDVRAVVKSIKENTPMFREFFKNEYHANLLLATYPVPVVSFLRGIVMGGGAGISVHGHFRIASESTLFSMPECAIGLFPDVGMSYNLARLDGELGMFLALTGYQLKGADVFWSRIATHYIEEDMHPMVHEFLSSTPRLNADRINYQLNEHATVDIPPFSLAEHMGFINTVFSLETLPEIMGALRVTDTPFAKKILAMMEKNSPLSMAITHRLIRMARDLSIRKCLRLEYRLSQRIALHPKGDFVEGVRAALIDKDQSPKWNFATVEEVTDSIVDGFFVPLDMNVDHSSELDLPHVEGQMRPNFERFALPPASKFSRSVMRSPFTFPAYNTYVSAMYKPKPGLHTHVGNALATNFETDLFGILWPKNTAARELLYDNRRDFYQSVPDGLGNTHAFGNLQAYTRPVVLPESDRLAASAHHRAISQTLLDALYPVAQKLVQRLDMEMPEPVSSSGAGIAVQMYERALERFTRGLATIAPPLSKSDMQTAIERFEFLHRPEDASSSTIGLGGAPPAPLRTTVDLDPKSPGMERNMHAADLLLSLYQVRGLMPRPMANFLVREMNRLTNSSDTWAQYVAELANPPAQAEAIRAALTEAMANGTTGLLDSFPAEDLLHVLANMSLERVKADLATMASPKKGKAAVATSPAVAASQAYLNTLDRVFDSMPEAKQRELAMRVLRLVRAVTDSPPGHQALEPLLCVFRSLPNTGAALSDEDVAAFLRGLYDASPLVVQIIRPPTDLLRVIDEFSGGNIWRS
ncbi:hypothetical protein H696_02239 [Fonticula alba]|uniref:3-hydroxyisobutyryl-CoA hydrolase n=1 Tax=Fonticula alba TaxID=691883 RepID=A0A058ZBJ6_FONAL|nr:hypothetical protein H696_02239 [Fonticula alba]KCV71293.1 hypothetical protein H696_02239 [Fonticula alba]|eukprot:XP_009494416.1 hypothetical protein H696_02239 [Fonticula alba]